MGLKRYRSEIQPDTEATVYVTTADNVAATELLAAPAANERYNITSLSVTVDTPGTDVVTATFLSDANTLLVVPLNTATVDYKGAIELLTNAGEAFNVTLSAAVDVHITFSYYVRNGAVDV